MKFAWRFGFVACASALGMFVYACGSDSNVSIPGGDDGGAGVDSGGNNTTDGSNGGSDGGGGGADSGQDAGAVPCAPSNDPKKAALCIVVEHETIAFLANDPRFDGLGAMIAQVFAHAVPDFPDGGEEPAIATVVLPGADGGADAGEFDLKSQTATFRFEVTPGTVYPRVTFIDNPTSALAPGWWFAGLDFSNGIKANLPLGPHKLAAGDAKGIRMSLTALRDLVVNVTRSATPAGNGQGVTTVIALDTNTYSASAKGFGVAQGCTNLEVAGTAGSVEGFVVGKGPYYLSTGLDDFDVGDAGSAGYLVSITDGGVIPPANKTTYPANAYVITHAVDLNVALPKPTGADKKSCP